MLGKTQFKLRNLFLAPLTTVNNFQLFLLWFLLRYLETNILPSYQLSSQLHRSNHSPGGRRLMAGNQCPKIGHLAPDYRSYILHCMRSGHIVFIGAYDMFLLFIVGL